MNTAFRNTLGAAVGLFALSGVANAAIVNYQITGGNWAALNQWTGASNGASGPTYDNGEVPPCTNCTSEYGTWNINGAPGAMTGTYGGTLSVDDTNNAVVGGTLVVTGSIADEVFVGSTWWVRQYDDVAINFTTNTVTSSGFACFDTMTAPVECSPNSPSGVATPGVIDANTAASLFTPLAGIASQDFGGLGGTF